MSDCEKISDMLLEYINKRLSLKENSEVVLHLAACQECRKEVSQLIYIRNIALSSMADIPEDIMKAAFEKIEKSTLEQIIDSGSYYMAFDLVNYVMALIQNTVQLAKQAILI